MKKFLRTIIILTVMLIPAVTFFSFRYNGERNRRIYDNAGVLSPSQHILLEHYARVVYRHYQMDVVLVINGQNNGSGAYELNLELAPAMPLEFSRRGEGAVLVAVDTDSRAIEISSRGTLGSWVFEKVNEQDEWDFTDYEVKGIVSVLSQELCGQEVYKPLKNFIKSVDKLGKFREIPFRTSELLAIFRYINMAPFVIAAIAIFISWLKRKMKKPAGSHWDLSRFPPV